MNIRMVTIELEDGTIYEVPGMMVTQVEIQMDRDYEPEFRNGDMYARIYHEVRRDMTVRLELRGVGTYGYRQGRRTEELPNVLKELPGGMNESTE